MVINSYKYHVNHWQEPLEMALNIGVPSFMPTAVMNRLRPATKNI